MKKFSRLHIAVQAVLVLGFAITTILSGLNAGRASAVGPYGPDPNDFMAGRRIELVVSRTTDVVIPQTWVKLYFNAPTGTVIIEDYQLCTDAPGSAGNYYDIQGSAVNGAISTRYELFNSTHSVNGAGIETESLGALQRTLNGPASAANTCRNQNISANLTGLSFSRDVGKYVAYIRATNLINTTQNSFRVHVTTNGFAVGYDSTIPASQFGMNQVSPLSGTSDYGLRFAPDCYAVDGEMAYAHWYDDDNGTAGIQPTPMRFQLRKYNAASGAYIGTEPFVYFHRTSDNSPVSFTQSGGWYTAYSGTRVDVTAAFRADKGVKYVWLWDNVYYNNTLQFKLPYDSIYFLTGCQIPTANYNLTPDVGMTITDPGGTPVSGNVAEVGDRVTFTYAVRNSGTTVSASTTCTTYANTHPGYFAVPTPAENTGPPGPATGCPRTFPANSNTQLTTETITLAADNQTVCRSLWVNPVLPAGGSRGDEACVVVAAKPYVKVYGGDVTAGNGFTTLPSTTCTNSTDSEITTWNKENATFDGSGTQYAAIALDAISDFATAQGGGGAAAPSGLAFANNTYSGTGSVFGGSFGAVPCAPDYYGAITAAGPTTLPSTNVSSLTSGAYSSPVGITLPGGVVNPNQRIQLAVNGNVYITSNITYAGSWANPSQIPLFELVVKGNIYIAPGVTQLDGVYIAQPNNPGTDGIIATCATAAAPVDPASATFFATCNNKLTVNGAFVANQVRLLRTKGSLYQSSPESGAATNAAEVFNYTPAQWIAQPTTPTNASTKYDAITSLPPIL
ncbi:MAG TPA: hypothetical protein VMY99_00260 [Nevskiaceae bacterium]|nr:hypothetical protein [Nevskiaceae bacterium]